MKNKIWMMLLLSMLILSCSKDENTNESGVKMPSLSFIEWNTDTRENLKDASQEEITKLIEKQIEELNTPLSEYKFYKNLERDGNIEEILEKWWMEITRWQIYISWFWSGSEFMESFLNAQEQKYVFHEEKEWRTFFYIDNLNNFVLNLKNKVWNVQYQFDPVSKKIIGISFMKDNQKYNGEILYVWEGMRGQVEDVLWTWVWDKIKIQIIWVK